MIHALQSPSATEPSRRRAGRLCLRRPARDALVEEVAQAVADEVDGEDDEGNEGAAD